MRKLLLLGAGHANLQVLRNLTRNLPAGWELNLIDENSIYTYSGGVPAWIAGIGNLQGIQIDLQKFCMDSGVLFTLGKVTEINSHENRVLLADGRKIAFDLLSINVGSQPRRISSLDDFRSVYVKPFTEFSESWREIERTCTSCFVNSYAVVGGGAAGIEIASALNTRFQIRKSFQSRVTLYTSGSLYFSESKPGDSEKVRELVESTGIKVVAPVKVNESKDGFLYFENGTRSSERYDKVFLLTSAVPPEWLGGTGLSVDSDGFLIVDECLRAGPKIFAAGDCVSREGSMNRRSGVRAVQHGKLLAKNLRRIMIGQTELIPYRSKAKELNILFMGENRGLLVWGDQLLVGSWPIKLKRFIDRRYLKKFQ